MSDSDSSTKIDGVQSLFPSFRQFHMPIISVKLTENNYLIWRQEVLAAVKAYAVDGYLNGSKIRPPSVINSEENEEGIPNPEFLLWTRRNQFLVSWLLFSLSESILLSTVGLDTFKETWYCLELRFWAKIMQQLQNIKKGSLSMRDYLNKIKGCCDVLNACGYKITSEDHVLYIMSGLGAEYNPVMVSISTKFDPISISEVSSLFLSFEARLEGTVTSSFSTEGSTPSANMATQGNMDYMGFD